MTIRKADELIRDIYCEVQLPEPIVIESPTLSEAAKDFKAWKPRIQTLLSVYWHYQYPFLIPGCYWERFHLKEEGYQFDLRRQPNPFGCFTKAFYFSRIARDTEELRSFWRDESRHATELLRSGVYPADECAERLFGQYGSFAKELADMIDQEDPSIQLSPGDLFFLGPFSWVATEFRILSALRDWSGIAASDLHYQILAGLLELEGIYLTFGDLVVYCRDGSG